MNLRRILANAVARRIAFVLVAAAFAWLGIGSARAQSLHQDGDQGAAYAHCKAQQAEFIAQGTTARPREVPADGGCRIVSNDRYHCYYRSNGFNGGPVNQDFFCGVTGYQHGYTGTCAGRPDYIGAPPTSTASGFPVPGAMSCMNGCSTAWYNNGDGTWTGDYTTIMCTPDTLREDCHTFGEGWSWNAYAGLCQPPKAKCETNQSKDPITGECKDACPVGMIMDADGVCDAEEAECPAGNVKAPSGECLPGDGQCAVGEARRPNGTCGKDSDGDGEADEDDEDPENDPEKETASGGDSCDSPPSCSGGAIACMQVKIQWRIDCNTRKAANVSGGTCGAVPVCTGKSCDALEYAQLLQQWKASCALEKIAAGGSGGGDGDAVVDLLTGPGSINSNAGGGDSLENGSPWGEGDEEFEPDASGYGYGRACPSPPSFTLPGGQSVSIDLTPLCNWVSLGGSMVLILAGLMCLRIVAGGTA